MNAVVNTDPMKVIAVSTISVQIHAEGLHVRNRHARVDSCGVWTFMGMGQRINNVHFRKVLRVHPKIQGLPT